VDDEVKVGLASGRLLWRALAEWFLSAVEHLLRGELIRDYRITADDLREARGHIDVFGTASNFLTGKLRFQCEFEEFDSDNPLNRILKAAILIVRQISGSDESISDRAARALLRFDDVGPLRPSDVRVVVDRHVKRYEDAVMLGRSIILGVARDLEAGQARGHCFLLRTPDLIEAGIRDLLSEHLASRVNISKYSRAIPNTKMRLNPDLVFDHFAVGDVKYKLGADWIRSDVYQALSFAVGFAVKKCAIISFSKESSLTSRTITLGDVSITHLCWPIGTSPDDAQRQLIAGVEKWLRIESRHEILTEA
jgi:5-methylcytosine-specific restriction endonuclease McrBC regulatory subunit McrC